MCDMGRPQTTGSVGAGAGHLTSLGSSPLGNSLSPAEDVVPVGLLALPLVPGRPLAGGGGGGGSGGMSSGLSWDSHRLSAMWI